MARTTVARSLHDLGVAAWFGGSLMGAIGVNGAAADVDDPTQRARVANAGWGRWTPVNLAAIGAHVLGGRQLVRANKGRVAAQQGVATNSAVKTGLTVAALGATGYSRLLRQKVMSHGDVPVAGGTAPLPSTPAEVAKAQEQLKAWQWVIPALTGGIIVSSALQGEQQRASEVTSGVVKGLPGRAVGAAGAAVKGAAVKGAAVKGAAVKGMVASPARLLAPGRVGLGASACGPGESGPVRLPAPGAGGP